MGNVIDDFELLYLVAACCGLLAGWLLWRWRRRSLPVAQYNRMVEFERNARSRLDALEAERDKATAELTSLRQQAPKPAQVTPSSPMPTSAKTSIEGERVLAEQDQTDQLWREVERADAERTKRELVEQQRNVWQRRAEESEVQRLGLAEQLDAATARHQQLADKLAAEQARAKGLADAVRAQRDTVAADHSLQEEVARLREELAVQQSQIELLAAELQESQSAHRAAERSAANSHRAHQAMAARNRVLEARSTDVDGTT